MLKSWLHRRIGRLERTYGYDATYLHEVADISVPAALKFGLFQIMAYHDEDLPRDLGFAARMAATLNEDCGPCAQLTVDMALESGMSPQPIAALMRGDLASAGDEAALGFRYGQAVAANTPAAAPLAEEVERRYRKRALVSLAYGVASARGYPALKRGPGHGAAGPRIQVAQHSLALAALVGLLVMLQAHVPPFTAMTPG